MPTQSSLALLSAFLPIALFLTPLHQAAAATLEGAVVDPDGRPVAGARVTLVSTGGMVAGTVTLDAGQFRLDPIPAGSFKVVVEAPGFRAEPTVVTVGEHATGRVRIALQVSAITETVVVAAAQVERPLSGAPVAVTVIPETVLAERQLETVAQALALVPGLQVAQNGGRGALTSVFPRGGESDFTLVAIDGIRLNAFGGGYDFSALNAADVERVEIVRGPQSAVFGADAIGGVVNIVTRRGGPTRGAALVEGGGLGTRRATLSGAGSTGRFEWGGAAERLRSDGFNGDRAATGATVGNDDWRFTQASLSAAVRAGGTTLRGHVRGYTSRRGFPGPFGADPNHTYGGVDLVSRGRSRTVAGGVAAEHRAGALRLRGDLAHVDIDGTFERPLCGNERRDPDCVATSASGTRRTSARVQADVAVTGRVGLSAGVEAVAERARSTFITDIDSRLVPVRRHLVGAFAEGRIDLAARTELSMGARLEHIQRDALPAGPFGSRPTFGSDTIVSLNPRAAISTLVHLSESGRIWTRVRASGGTGIRPPDAFEIAFTDNPALEPERNRSVEVAVEQAVLGGAMAGELTAFSNRYDDLIVAVGRSFADASRYRTDNISNARARGVELSLTGRSRRLSVQVAYTWLDTAILAVDGRSGQAPPPFAVGEPLIRRPRHRASTHLTWVDRRWNAFARLGTRGRVLDVDPSFGAFGGKLFAAGYAVADVGGAFAVGRGAEVFGRVLNVLDRRYEEALGFPALGRHAMVGVRFAARR